MWNIVRSIHEGICFININEVGKILEISLNIMQAKLAAPLMAAFKITFKLNQIQQK